MERIVAVIKDRGLRVFDVIDHQGAATEVGLALRPTRVVVFGSPQAGTPLMVERPLILAEKGFGAKNLLALENRNPLHLVIRKDHPAKEVKDLKGTKLGMTRAGSGTDLSLRALLKDAGLEPDRDVAIIAVGGVSSATAALKAGQIDGYMGGEPALGDA